MADLPEQVQRPLVPQQYLAGEKVLVVLDKTEELIAPRHARLGAVLELGDRVYGLMSSAAFLKDPDSEYHECE